MSEQITLIGATYRNGAATINLYRDDGDGGVQWAAWGEGFNYWDCFGEELVPLTLVRQIAAALDHFNGTAKPEPKPEPVGYFLVDRDGDLSGRLIHLIDLEPTLESGLVELETMERIGAFSPYSLYAATKVSP